MVYHVALGLEATSLYADGGIIVCYALIGQDGVVLTNVADTTSESPSANPRILRTDVSRCEEFQIPKQLTRFAHEYAEAEKNLLKQMIRDLWNLNGLHPSLRIITYNGYNFDYPMIITRLLALEMYDEVARFKKNFDMRSKHLDLYSVIRSNILIKSRKLEDICKYFGIGYERDAKETLELCEKGEAEILKKRCAAHAEVLHKIRRKLIDLNILESG